MQTFRTSAMITLLLLSGGLRACAADKPNIVFCFADDWGRYASCYAALDAKPTANSVIYTPNIDTVARRGVIFRNAFVPAPSCTPCRSSLLSGRYFFNTGRGAILNGAIWDENIPAFPLLLRDGGYEIGKMAKVWSPGTPADAPIGKQQYAYQKSGMGFNQFSQQVIEAVNKGKDRCPSARRPSRSSGRELQQFLEGTRCQSAVLLLVWSHQRSPKVDQGFRKGALGYRPGHAPGEAPEVPAGRARGTRGLRGLPRRGSGVRWVRRRSAEATPRRGRNGKHHRGDQRRSRRARCSPAANAIFTTSALGWRWSPRGRKFPGPRVVDDLVNLMDLAPTFLDMGGVKHPPGLNSKSLWPLLTSKRAGQVDPDRTWVVTGRERHVGDAREGNKPYPQRAIRTEDYLYVRNFEPDRRPLGDPRGVTADKQPSANDLENDTHAAFADMDASPTKAWLIAHRNDKEWKWHYDYAFAKRPAEELYDLKADPDQVKNLAGEKEYDATRKKLADQLTKILIDAGDPRLVETDCRFEKAPFTDFGPRKK